MVSVIEILERNDVNAVPGNQRTTECQYIYSWCQKVNSGIYCVFYWLLVFNEYILFILSMFIFKLFYFGNI